eukprot:13887402-Alexandrium_andersonii.AAC.1
MCTLGTGRIENSGCKPCLVGKGPPFQDNAVSVPIRPAMGATEGAPHANANSAAIQKQDAVPRAPDPSPCQLLGSPRKRL